MWKFLLGYWVLTSMFDNPHDRQRKRYNKLVARHRKQMDERTKNYIRLIKKNSIAERAIADFFGDHLGLFSLEEIDYILGGIYQELPEAAVRIARMINELPVTPQKRGYGVEFI